MALLKVAVMGHPVLRKMAEPVPEADIKSPRIQQLLADMVETMYEYDGRGLAAPQIHESLQIVVMLWDFDEGKKPYVAHLINPSLKPLTTDTSAFWEGCLSVPGLRGLVARPNRVAVSAFNGKGERINFIAEGFAATVVQHECDHLNATLYVDRLTDKSKFAFNREYQKFLAKPDEDTEAADGE